MTHLLEGGDFLQERSLCGGGVGKRGIKKVKAELSDSKLKSSVLQVFHDIQFIMINSFVCNASFLSFTISQK